MTNTNAQHSFLKFLKVLLLILNILKFLVIFLKDSMLPSYFPPTVEPPPLSLSFWFPTAAFTCIDYLSL